VTVTDGSGAPPIEGQVAIALFQVLAKIGVPAGCFLAPDPGLFKAASGKNSARCSYNKGGIKEGQMFFLREGLCFAPAPPTFIPRGDIRALELPRHGSASSTFDLLVHTKSGEMHEFLQVGTEETAAVSRWATAVRVRVGEPPSESGSGSDGGGDKDSDGAEGEERGDEDDSDYDEEEDSDFDVEREEAVERGEVGGEGGEDSSDEDSGSGSAEMVSEEGVGVAAIQAAEEKEVGSKKRKAGGAAGPSGTASPASPGPKRPAPFGGAASSGGEGAGDDDDEGGFEAV